MPPSNRLTLHTIERAAAARHREHVLEAVRQTLLRDARCWLLLASGLAFSLWVWSGSDHAATSLASLILTLQVWFWLGHALSGPRLAEATAQSRARMNAIEGFPPR